MIQVGNETLKLEMHEGIWNSGCTMHVINIHPTKWSLSSSPWDSAWILLLPERLPDFVLYLETLTARHNCLSLKCSTLKTDTKLSNVVKLCEFGNNRLVRCLYSVYTVHALANKEIEKISEFHTIFKRYFFMRAGKTIEWIQFSLDEHWPTITPAVLSSHPFPNLCLVLIYKTRSAPRLPHTPFGSWLYTEIIGGFR